MSYGLVDVANPVNSFDNFNVQISLAANDSTYELTAQDGATTVTLATGLANNVWHDIWLFINNATNTFDVYLGASGDPDVLVTKVNTDPLAFRNATTNSLTTFATGNPVDLGGPASSNGSAHINNLYFIPESSTALLGALGLLALLRRRR